VAGPFSLRLATAHLPWSLIAGLWEAIDAVHERHTAEVCLDGTHHPTALGPIRRQKCCRKRVVPAAPPFLTYAESPRPEDRSYSPGNSSRATDNTVAVESSRAADSLAGYSARADALPALTDERKSTLRHAVTAVLRVSVEVDTVGAALRCPRGAVAITESGIEDPVFSKAGYSARANAIPALTDPFRPRTTGLIAATAVLHVSVEVETVGAARRCPRGAFALTCSGIEDVGRGTGGDALA
jgi:hypothetical protein